ncbi:vegetative cell wall protein gp1-like [Triticum urartu]|uniref:vegetative cell wall protein gp1-like n=1 Tax=Triticum urartu TaxID=4572 RepID=UPI002044286B|nr:vegetative cell wall protein gp1-like [Triticum urartu]
MRTQRKEAATPRVEPPRRRRPQAEQPPHRAAAPTRAASWKKALDPAVTHPPPPAPSPPPAPDRKQRRERARPTPLGRHLRQQTTMAKTTDRRPRRPQPTPTASRSDSPPSPHRPCTTRAWPVMPPPHPHATTSDDATPRGGAPRKRHQQVRDRRPAPATPHEETRGAPRPPAGATLEGIRSGLVLPPRIPDQ